MPAQRIVPIRRREFLQIASLGGLAVGLGARPAAAEEDEPHIHNMAVFGEETVFFSHLPMFGDLDEKKSDYTSPHRFQVILEAAFTKDQLDAYRKDRKANPAARLYTMGPKAFVLSRLFTPAAAPKLTSFTCSVFRGHLEVPSSVQVPGLDEVAVKIARVVHGRKFDPRAAKPATLEYLLIGRGKERFLAHAIFAPPDFDQLLPVSFLSAELSDAELRQDVRVAIPDRKNIVSQRLRPGQRVEATLKIGAAAPRKVQIEAGPQIYFEEGELLMPAELKPTEEEKKDKQG
jgi:hypothetical protein